MRYTTVLNFLVVSADHHPPRGGARRGSSAPTFTGFRFLRAAIVVFVLFAGTGAAAEICTIDDVPAATLLLPYFEVSLDSGAGTTTVFSVNNAGSEAVLAHVVLWTDLAVPTVRFDLYLTGYDVATVNLTDIFLEGRLPERLRAPAGGRERAVRGAPAGVDLVSCRGQSQTALDRRMLEELGRIHSGKASSVFANPSNGLARCAARTLGDDVARGYITIDTVRACSSLVPGEAGYFVSGGEGIATNQNVLWGDWFILDNAADQAFGESLVAIEAAPGTRHDERRHAGNPETTSPGEYTFYGAFVEWSAADNREPLPTAFAVRYFDENVRKTDLIAWRDPKVRQQPFSCPAQIGRPPWYPLQQDELEVFDEEETLDYTPPCPVTCPPGVVLIPFPAATQRVAVGAESFPTPFASGWILMNLGTTLRGGPDVPYEDPFAAQGWVVTLHRAEARYGMAINATQRDDGCNAARGVVDY